ncbi:MAG: choice-of-anchor tandem repeat GloVer-containing protein [Terriglobales bacterium]
MKMICVFCVCLAWLAGLSSAQTYTVLYQFRAGLDGTYPVSGVTLDTQRRALYGTTENDGQFATGTVFKFDKHGESVLHSFTGETGDGQYPYGNGNLIVDAAGNLLGATEEGGIYGGKCGLFGCGVVFKVDPSGNETVLYQFQGAPNGRSPQGPLAVDASGNLYGMTLGGGQSGLGTVFKLDPSGNETILYSFTFSSGDVFEPYSGFVRDRSGNIYGCTYGGGDTGLGGIFKIDPAGNESVLHSFGDGEDGITPCSNLTLDAKGNLYGMTNAGGTNFEGIVFKITPAGKETVLYNLGANSEDAQSPWFSGVVLDPSGVLYGVTTAGGAFGLGAVFKLDSAGHESVIHSFNGADGKVPYGTLTRDPQGNLYGTTSQGGAYGGGVIFRIKP